MLKSTNKEWIGQLTNEWRYEKDETLHMEVAEKTQSRLFPSTTWHTFLWFFSDTQKLWTIFSKASRWFRPIPFLKLSVLNNCLGVSLRVEWIWMEFLELHVAQEPVVQLCSFFKLTFLFAQSKFPLWGLFEHVSTSDQSWEPSQSAVNQEVPLCQTHLPNAEP